MATVLDPNGPIHALGIRDEDGSLMGITHYLFHPHACSATESCYLQDLFGDAACWGRGYAAARIAAVGDEARARGLTRMYWLAHETNVTARRLCDRVAKNVGFIRYEYPLA